MELRGVWNLGVLNRGVFDVELPGFWCGTESFFGVELSGFGG